MLAALFALAYRWWAFRALSAPVGADVELPAPAVDARHVRR
jgi:hypothetical protein